MQIDKYTISELETYAKSTEYLAAKNIPISPERIASHLLNPRAISDKAVLFILKEDEKIIAYRTVLPDKLIHTSGSIPFAWLSGSFVLPDYRRKGYSTMLFETVQKEWEGQLMYTNYAPAAKKVFDKTDSFQQFLYRTGSRFYVRDFLTPLLSERLKLKTILKTSDTLINKIQDKRLRKFSISKPEGADIESINELDPELQEFIHNQQKESLFQREAKEFNWIKSTPWITEEPQAEIKGDYQFSRIAKNFKNLWFKITSNNEIAFLWITLVDRKMSIPYFFYTHPFHLLAAKKIICDLLIENKTSYLTIRQKSLTYTLSKKPHPFILKKAMPQRYFAHVKLLANINGNNIVWDGDGDGVFT